MQRITVNGSLPNACRSVLLWFSLLILWPLPALAQINTGGIPWSFHADSRRLPSGEVALPPPDLEAVAAEDFLNPLPYRFAINLPVHISIPDPGSGIRDPGSGIWTTVPSGDRIWLLTIHAPGALALTVYFDRFQLPAGGKLYLYNPERSMILGAFTELNNSKEGTFATCLIPGDRITIEYDHPVSCPSFPSVSVAEIAYAYRGVSQPPDGTGFGASGVCEVNVICPEGNGWWDQQKGVARLGAKKYGGTYWCSGSLVNNTRQDLTPYFLTADHCGKGATSLDISQWIFYFNYQSPTCPDPPEEPGYRSLTGAVLKASSGDVNISGSDFFLVCLNQSIPDTFDTWFNGWNRLDSPSPSGVGIHHPMGDIKKISTYTSQLVSTNWNGHAEMTHWEVVWAGTVSGHGVTEGGSSGSPLLDPEGRIVGTLTGGNALCDSGSLTQPDYYGKFSYSWDLNGSDSTKRLDYWLDPDQTGAETLDGIPLYTPDPVPVSADLFISPNPVSGVGHPESAAGPAILYFRSSFFVSSQIFRIIILDSWGREVMSVIRPVDPTGRISLDVSSLPDGFYVVKVLSEKRTLTGRIIRL